MDAQWIWIVVTAAAALAVTGIVAAGVRRSQVEWTDTYDSSGVSRGEPRADIEQPILVQQELGGETADESLMTRQQRRARLEALRARHFSRVETQ